MSLPLVKQILLKPWDYSACIPISKWGDLWLSDREIKLMNNMRKTAQRPALPLPHFWQGLSFNIMDYKIDGPGTCTYQQTDNTCSINFESCHPFVKDHKKHPPVNSGRSFGKSCSIHFENGRPIVLGANDGFKIVN